MVKIFLSVRNRLSITVKCIEALHKHSTLPHQIYVYDNSTNYLLDEHFQYFYEQFRKGVISQICFTSKESTFNAFSKASTCNFFGKQHQEDPEKNNYSFLVMLDNDIIVTEGWDQKVKIAWKYVNKHKMNEVKLIGQLPGGIKGVGPEIKIGDMTGRIGHLGGSGLWTCRPNFFEDVGFLDLKLLVKQNKKHDQHYWQKLVKASGGRNYILGLNEKLGIHCGKEAGSVCNSLTRNKECHAMEIIKFKEPEKTISKLDFDSFYKKILNDQKLIKDW